MQSGIRVRVFGWLSSRMVPKRMENSGLRDRTEFDRRIGDHGFGCQAAMIWYLDYKRLQWTNETKRYKKKSGLEVVAGDGRFDRIDSRA